MKEAVILAGGFGTRLQEVVRDVPKPMAPVHGRPFLEYQFDYLIGQGMEHVVLSLGYMAETVIAHFGPCYRSLRISYAIENHPLGTGGAIVLAAKQLHGDLFWVLNGDSLFEVDLVRMAEAWSCSGAEYCIALRNIPDVSRYGQVEMDDQGRICRFSEKGGGQNPGLINGGVYLMQRKRLFEVAPEGPFSIEKELFMTENRLFLLGYVCTKYFIDIGIPEDYQRAQHEFIQR
ncbi:MAG: nucleotidyltransferase family protein [Bacteroidales bacterium]|nr:nucleotidyltransferase family protein [Bacteroidales bacterium]